MCYYFHGKTQLYITVKPISANEYIEITLATYLQSHVSTRQGDYFRLLSFTYEFQNILIQFYINSIIFNQETASFDPHTCQFLFVYIR